MPGYSCVTTWGAQQLQNIVPQLVVLMRHHTDGTVRKIALSTFLLYTERMSNVLPRVCCVRVTLAFIRIHLGVAACQPLRRYFQFVPTDRTPVRRPPDPHAEFSGGGTCASRVSRLMPRARHVSHDRLWFT